MRRENRRMRTDDGMDVKKMLFITGSILALAVIAFIITFFVYGNKLNERKQLSQIDMSSLGTITAEETSTSYGKTVNEMQESIVNDKRETKIEEDETKRVAVNTSVVDTKKEETTTTATEKEDKEETKVEITKTEEKEKENESETETVPDPEFKMPVKGKIMKEFANNKLVYSSTLDVWTTHNGIDIAADKTTVVVAAADGTVSSIKNDPRYGLTIIIEHVNGYKTVYSNLLTTEFVVEGEKVTQGQTIGTVGNTAAFEIADESHLHFELLKNNEQQDPELYLK